MIITADDFGFTNDTNIAVLNLINDKLITQASLMVNQKGTQNAINLIKKYNLKNIGLHFNITQGNSISNPNITFSKETWRELSEDFIEEELKAQVKVFTDNNILLHHIDSHHNVHLRSDFINNLMKNYNVRIRTHNSDGFHCDGDELNFVSCFCLNVDELGTHVAISTKDLTDTVLLENRVKEYNFFYKNKDLVQFYLRG